MIRTLQDMFHSVICPSGKNNIFVVFSAISLISFAIFYPLLLSSPWIIDDHEIAWKLSEFRQGISFWEALLSTEVGEVFNSLRYRPSYYLLRLLEIKAFGFEMSYWYFTRISIFILLHISLYTFLFKKYGQMMAIAAVLVSFLFLSWSELISKAGPAETYQAFGLSLILLSLSFSKRTYSIALFCVGMLIAAGAKENFAIFSLLGPIFLQEKYTHNKSTYLIVVLSSCILSIFPLWSALYSISTVGADVYGNSAPDALIILSHLDPYIVFFIVAALFLICLLTIKGLLGKININLYILLVFLLAFLFQLYFYKNYWEFDVNYLNYYGRYIFPANILIILITAMIYGYISNRALPMFPESCNKKVKLLFMSIPLIVAILFIIYYGKNLISNHSTAVSFANKSKTFWDSIKIVSTSEADEYIIVVSNIRAYEPAFSIMRFLRYLRGEDTKFSIYLNMSRPQDVIGERLFDNLDYAHKKVGQYSFPRDVNIIQVDRMDKKKCVELHFNIAKDVQQCLSRFVVTY